ncbi:hypothetical protein MUK70_00475 [Dyadobacter chenwenxiniae]|uniref:Uncharacterized protein n=1 Tax=Dyadobacter chenwenxiniae TaxID=2906456 RepID=A0A9X1PRP3_9BACT|nr:hypothetical protein [Dyadobacter chenwenxiniae]MCF0063801.1 hypothetical protein [Dyadobacter chenwenxiniae]UON83477.1 hypothetical protein MUK70_00475 [Dyadobacter chenwenxiniae]
MKAIISLYIIALALFIMSCDDHNTANLAPEYLYDAGNQKVIKSILNNKKGTIAMLYGNDLALQSAHDSLPKPNIGAHYTLVTWKQKPMPQWYGTNMNGEIYSIETLKIVKRNKTELTFDYEFQIGKGYKPADWQSEKSQRISFITSQRAAIFP